MRDVLDVEMLRRRYRDDGFCVAPPVVAQDVLDEATVAAEAVAAGESDTGLAPKLRERERGDGPQRLVKIAEPHNCSHVLRRLVAHPGIWRLAAAVTGARALQIWAVDLFIKRPTEEAPVGNIGWHQDGPFAPYWQGDIFTVWLALSAVSADASPLRYVPGSQRLGPLGRVDLFRTDLDPARTGLPLPDGFRWSEVTAEVAAGGLALHQRDTLHASGPNRSAQPRRSLAIRVRTERCVLDGEAAVARREHLRDEALAPVVYGDARLLAR
ncbi:phytanoyl-CoA dioxygenase family protein [Micromonospora sp. CPCC 205546]|uniref:phytanoyl-CoA dioxygenase family protein n=1 Tax=Micromonospora sp. CPCC 205546 TaxID=3122397 RepID=UPI002FF3DCFD